MADIQLNSVTLATESGGTVVLDSAVAGIPAAGVTGVLPVGVTGGSGLTALASNPTVTLGSNATFPTGHILQTAHVSTGSTSISWNSGSSGDWKDSGVETSLTPASGNKIMVMAYATVGSSGSGEGTFRVQRKLGSGSWGNPSLIADYAGTNAGRSQVGGRFDSVNTYETNTFSCFWLDTPSSTLECFYRIEIFYWNNTVYLNRPDSTSNTERMSGTTGITLFEVQQ